jgi:hypothetical protein
VALAELAAQVAQEALAEPAAQVAQEALAEPAVPGELAVRAASEALDVQVARAELVVRAVSVELDDQVVPAELEHGLVVAVPELDPVAVPLRTKSVTAQHRRGLVPEPKRVEDLAAAAETTREPVVIEAAKAWVAAV